MIEIGSDYNFNWFDCLRLAYSKTYSLSDNHLYFFNGRIALKYIINNLSNYHFIIPNYLCASINDQFEKKIFYNITDNLTIDINYLENIISTNKHSKLALLTIDFFGIIDDNINIIQQLCKKHDILIIQDFTHNIFTKNLYGDLCYCSYRKMLPTPAGGYIIDNAGILPPQEFSINIKYILFNILKCTAMTLKNWSIKPIWRPILNFCETNIDNVNYTGFDYINFFVYKLLETNKKIIINKRKINSQYLQKNLIHPTIYRLRQNIFAYPLLFKSKEERDKMRNILISHKIYCPIYWPNEHLLSTMILFIPIDQRYSPLDYKNMLKLFAV